MTTIEEIKRGISFIEALTDNSETFEGHGNLCDIYFNSFNNELKQSQVDVFNEFKQSPKKYVNESNNILVLLYQTQNQIKWRKLAM